MAEMHLLTEARIERDQDYWPDRTIVDYLEAAVDAVPDRTAFVDLRVEHTYAELDERSDAIAAGLAENGIGKGDRVSVQLPNWNEFVLVRLALAKLGAVINPIPPIYRASDLEYMVDLLDPSAFVIPDKYGGHDYVTMVRDTLAFDGAIYTVAADGTTAPQRDGTRPFAELADDPATTEFPGLDPTYDLSEVIFTSGTTGRPKGVMHTENTLMSATVAYNERAQVTTDAVPMMPSTLGHQTGFLYGATSPILAQATGVLLADWDPERAVELVEELSITHIAGATPFLHDFVGADNLDAHDTSALDHFLSYGAPIPRPLLTDANKQLDCTVYGGWGQTEDALVTLSRPDDPDEKITNTDGYPLDNMEIQVVDEEGEQLPGGSGRLLCRGPFLMTGFYDRPERTSESMQGDWYVTGDLASIDDEGYVSITGREKDIIIRGGENVPVGQIEDILHEHEKVDEVAIVAMPDDRLQERGCAYVKPVEGETFTFKDMTDFLRERDIATQFFPEHLVLLQNFPRTPSGKIQKYNLREDIAESLGKDPINRG